MASCAEDKQKNACIQCSKVWEQKGRKSKATQTKCSQGVILYLNWVLIRTILWNT